jgi:PAS domain S-box-containing protein
LDNDIKSILDSIPNPTIVADSSGIVLEFNKASQILTGYDPNSIIGVNIENLPFQSFLQKSGNKILHTSWFSVDGTLSDITWHEENITIKGSSCKLLTGAVKNDGSSSCTHYRNVENGLEEMDYGICIIDRDERLLYANAVLTKISGYSSDELRKIRIRDIAVEFDIEGWQKLWTDLMPSSGSMDISLIQKNGQKLAVSLRYHKSVYLGKPALFCTFQDISKNLPEKIVEFQKKVLLAEVSDVTFKLATVMSDENMFSEQIGRVGRLLKVDRIRIIRILDDEGNYNLCCNWHSNPVFEDSVSLHIPKPLLDNFKKETIDNRYFLKHTREMEEQIRQESILSGIRTLFLLPIFNADKIWGLISYVSCNEEKAWTDWEIDICSSLGSSLSVIIDNFTNRKEHEISERKLGEAFQIIPDGLAIINKNNLTVENINAGFTRLIGKSDNISFNDIHAFLHRISNSEQFQLIAESLHGDKPINDIEVVFRDSSNQEVVGILSSNIIRIDGTVYVTICIRDVTQLVRSSQRARQSEENLERTFDLAPDPMLIIADGVVARANKKFFEQSGYSKVMVEEESIDVERIFGSDATRLFCSYDDAKTVSNIPVTVSNMNGTTTDYLLSMDGYKDFGLKSKICILHDITEIILLQNRLRESLDRYEKLAETVQNGILVLCQDKVIYFNQACMDMTGYSREELLSVNIFDLIHADDKNHIYGNYQKRISGLPYEDFSTMRVVRKDGQVRHFNYRVSKDRIDNLDMFIITLNDVTDLEQARLNAVRSNTIVETIVSSVHDVAFVKDVDGRFTYFKWPAMEQAGHRFDHYIGKTLNEVTPEMADLEIVENYRKKVLETGKSVSYTRSMTHLGQTVTTDYIIQVSPFVDSSGKLIGTIGIAHNITDQIKTEKKLKQLENRLTTISQNIMDIIFQLDGDRIAYISPSISIYGYIPEQLVGASIKSLFNVNLLDGSHPGSHFTVDSVLYGINGMSHDMEVRVAKGADSTIGVARDISERKNLEKAKKNFLKSVAHELRNPLTLILGYSELLVNTTRDDKDINNMASIIYDAAESEKKRLNEFFDLDKGNIEYNFEIVDVSKVLNNTYTKLWMLIPKLASQKHKTDKSSFNFFTSPQINGRKISIDTNKFSEIIENLATNAVKYSPTDRIAINLQADIDDKNLVIRFSDKGIGIPAKELPFIFKPFYQINQTGFEQDGLGLGLATVKMHTQAHGGSIDVTSDPGEGSVFTLKFPLLD